MKDQPNTRAFDQGIHGCDPGRLVTRLSGMSALEIHTHLQALQAERALASIEGSQ